MHAGEMNHRITIQQKRVVPDADGYAAETWVDFATIWAQVITSGGREFYAAQKLHAETSAVFKIRYTQKVNTRQRIKYGSRTFEILNIADPDGARVELNISAKETTAIGQTRGG